jgi:uncharacterized repeat protein (TIGR03803 family)
MRAVLCVILALSMVGCAREASSPPTLALPNEASRSAGSTVYKTLYSFKAASDGFHPTTALVPLHDVFYGTTTSGGYAGSGPCDGCGTVYSITTSGTETVVYKFPGPPGGRGPEGNVIAAGGALYGTTFYGGDARAPRRCMPIEKGCGVVFSIDRNGTESILHAFRGGDDGENPAGGVVRGTFPARSGFYGTTATSSLQGVFGTVFIVTADREETLHRFAGPPNDGEFPVGSPAIIEDKLYGETATGGAHNLGAIFEVTVKRGEPPAEKLLWSFSGQDGSDPAGGLTEINGALYGVTSTGGPHNFGVLFAVTPHNSYHLIHAFRGRLHGDGADPQSPPIFVNGTTLYGTTYRGGTNGRGTVYAIDQHGNETVLHSFGPAPDGVHPRASLLWSNGTLYGTTAEGGAGDAVGTVFALTPP